MQVLHDSFEYVVKHSAEKIVLNQQFESDLESFSLNKNFKSISKENIIRGNNLLEYYNKHKLILAGYSSDVDEPILNVFTELINEFNPLDNSV